APAPGIRSARARRAARAPPAGPAPPSAAPARQPTDPAARPPQPRTRRTAPLQRQPAPAQRRGRPVYPSAVHGNDGWTDLGYARLDTDRVARTGDPEVVYGAGKTTEQVVGIVAALREAHPDRAALVTRTDEATRRALAAGYGP